MSSTPFRRHRRFYRASWPRLLLGVGLAALQTLSLLPLPVLIRRVIDVAIPHRREGEIVWEARGAERGGLIAYEPPPEARGLQGAGTVHHVAWASTIDDHEAWRERVSAGGGRPTPVIDRFYFRSIYFREPSGVLFEIATLGPGFTVDEPLESLGESLSLPPDFEHLRPQVEAKLKPVHSPRQVPA